MYKRGAPDMHVHVLTARHLLTGWGINVVLVDVDRCRERGAADQPTKRDRRSLQARQDGK